MRLFHGSTKKFRILKPKKGKGLNEFENQKAIFLTKTFLHSSLYAIGKNLKGKTGFGVTPKKLVILENHKLKPGYVYEVEVTKPIKGHHEQYASKKLLIPLKITKVYPKDLSKNIIYVKTKEELINKVVGKSKNLRKMAGS